MRKYVDRKGVKTVKLFKETWKVGRYIEKKGSPPHIVIYGPDDKEHHVYGDDAISLLSCDDYRDEFYIDKTKLKIYILTSILDNRDNWSFDMSKHPIIDRKVKVIYEDCTIKWVDFTGNWDNNKKEIHDKEPFYEHPTWFPLKLSWRDRTIYKNIVAWRKL
jgi:hypothetical protein